MSAIFVNQVVRQAESVYRPVLPPDDPHPTRGTWVNNALNEYRTEFGEADYAQYSRNDVPFPMPPDSLSERRRLWWRMRKAQAMFGFKALATGRRATHTYGVAGRGTVTVAARPEFPDHEFFSPGRVFKVRIRHANASYKDDACCQVRACSIKFADSDCDSPLDIIMNTGVIQAFWNFDTFMRFAFARIKTNEHSWDSQREWMRLLPGGMVGSIESLRIAPASYAEMLYHTCIAYPFRAKDGRMRYAKYRLVPHGLVQESGLMGQDRQKLSWVQSRTTGDPRPIRYLADEYRSRLSRGPVEYALQIQLNEFDPERDTHEFFNSARVWDPRLHPWLDLATLRVNEAIPDDVMERMKMRIGHQPPSLGLTDAYSYVDYRSLAWVRYRVYPVSQANRWLLRTLGWQRKLPQDF